MILSAGITASLQEAYAQTVFDTPSAAAVAVEECDDSQNRSDGAPVATDDNSSGTSAATIVDRLSQPSSGVTAQGPAALMRRALPAAHSAADSAPLSQTNADEPAESDETERVVRTKSGKTVGFRVQVYADNNVRAAKNEARQREREVGQAFPAYSTYVSYASPYWRLRVGDFPTQYDAEKAASEIRKAFPRYAREVRVVRDRINAH